jgi:hypothetical protein
MGDYKLSDEIPEKDLFMMCNSLNSKATRELPKGYHVRFLKSV